MMGTVLHLVPYDTLAGVETAVRSVPARWQGSAGPVRFRRGYLVLHSLVVSYPDDWHGPDTSENDPRAQWRMLRFALTARPDVVVASLWRCCPVMIALKILRPRTIAVLFLHSAVDVHFVDRWFTRAAMLLADEIWADSATTLEARVPARMRHRSRVISFLTERPGSIPDRSLAREGWVAPSFVFWGRLQSEKDLSRALEVFAAIHLRMPKARFDIIGPDRGEQRALEETVRNLKLDDAVSFVGPLPHKEVLDRARGYRFYLQTSRFEGMAMSVVEAMSLGLVPVVTPVGEIPRYCDDNESGIFVTTPEQTAARVLDLIANPERYYSMSARAAERWADAALFRDEYMAACDHLLRALERRRLKTARS